ncbi:GYDIA family GHMP kinase [uncultured Planktosalinus sp.]|uniref:GYDIA family GHMP kinase n=1 Tax=uncultured Planktosalinus sp. TaxID=1810935 RepID=UPI0030DB140D
MKTSFYSNGKLLLSAEYFVLDGAEALAIPTKYGQSLEVNLITEALLNWKSFDHQNKVWFEGSFDIENSLQIRSCSNEKIAHTLQTILSEAKKLNPLFLNRQQGIEVKSNMTFPREWGLGSSSTLINNIAQWAKVDAYELLRTSFGGSGYDIACAQHSTPLIYSNKTNPSTVKNVAFKPSFSDALFFVYLNKKKDSKEAIHYYKKNTVITLKQLAEFNELTQEFLKATSLPTFEKVLNRHENLVSSLLGLEKVKDRLFSDYGGAVKSLGGWGGDFILATGEEATSYFKNKGYEVVIPYSEMIK